MFLRITLTILLGVAVCINVSESEITAEFGNFLREFGKKYDTLEETLKRYEIFAENYRQIQEHNSYHPHYKLGVNQFSDLTLKEFEAIYLRRRGPTRTPCTLKHTKTEAKPELDWREKGAVSSVKIQVLCGSCWAFSAVGALEGHNVIKNGGPLVEYSVQELVDCSVGYGDNHGCRGGDMSQAFEYIKDRGISTEKEYPYEGRDKSCRKVSKSIQIAGCVNVTRNDNDELLEALNIGPVSVAVKASNNAFRNYKSGIITDGCGTEKDELTHGIVLVGAGIDQAKGIPYWIVKNSWGTSWGMKGYLLIKRDTGKSQGVCGIAMENSYPIL